MVFAWDPDTAAANVLKHGVRFEYATRMCHAPDHLEREDRSGLSHEGRDQAIGMVERRRLVVALTDRGDHIRILSARRATPRE
jgi:uncharacterized DUF497 family protein